MADNIQIPSDLTKVITVEVKDTSQVLKKFLVELANTVNKQNERIKTLEAKVGN